MDRERHCGYTNYATFLVDVTATNDRERHTALLARAQAAWDAAEATEHMTRSWNARLALAETLKDDAESALEKIEGMSARLERLVPQIVRDMARAGFDQVDWDDIAHTWLTRLEEWKEIGYRIEPVGAAPSGAA